MMADMVLTLHLCFFIYQPLNQVVLWDKIIVRGENAILNLKNANTKYYFWDYGNGLKYVWMVYCIISVK